MRLRHEERVLKTIKRHKTPYVFALSKIAVIVVPLYILAFYFGRDLDIEFSLILFFLISFFAGIIIVVISVDYLFDRLLITNKRVIWINWKSIFKKEEHEAEFIDIQDIETREKGLLSKLKIFDYGFMEIETASSKTCVTFNDCPDPDGVKHFILGEMERHHMSLKGKKENAEHPEEWSVN